jgi:hypothetical protein
MAVLRNWEQFQICSVFLYTLYSSLVFGANFRQIQLIGFVLSWACRLGMRRELDVGPKTLN